MAWVETPYESFGEGIVRNYAFDDPDYPRGGLWDALNIVYDLSSDNPEKMRGTSQLGSDISGTPAVTGLFDYANGTELVATCDDGKIYKRTSGDFSQITDGTGFNTTSTTRWSGNMFYGVTSTANLLILCNGIDTPKKYNGTAISALGGSPPATGNYPTPWLGRLWMAAGDTLYYSASNDAEDFAGGGSIQVYRGWGGNITGLTVYAGALVIFKRTAIFYMNPTTTLNETSILNASPSVGCVSHWTVADAGPRGGDYLMFMSDYGIEAMRPTDRQGNWTVDNVSETVGFWMDRRNAASHGTAWATFSLQRKEYLLYAATGSRTVPSEGLIANTARSRAPIRWTRTDFPNFTAGAMVLSGGKYIQVVGNSAGQVFQMHTGDDLNGNNYRGYIYTRAYSQGRPHYQKRYGWLYVSAETEGGYSVNVRPVLGRRNLPTSPNLLQLLNAPGGDGWGVGKWGEAVWGGSATSGTRIRPTRAGRGNYLRVQLDTPGANQWFRLTGLVIASKLGAASIAA